MDEGNGCKYVHSERVNVKAERVKPLAERGNVRAERVKP